MFCSASWVLQSSCFFGRGAGDFALGPALLILFSASCWAFGSYVQPRLWLPANLFVVAAWEMLFGGLMMVVLGLSVGESFTFDYAPKTWFALSYLVIFGSVVAFTAYVWLVANAPISLVATYAYVNPVIAVFLGWLILDEKITWPIVAGGAIVVASRGAGHLVRAQASTRSGGSGRTASCRADCEAVNSLRSRHFLA